MVVVRVGQRGSRARAESAWASASATSRFTRTWSTPSTFWTRPRDLDQRRGVERDAKAPELLRREHRVRGAGLVFDGEEADAVRGAGSLAHDHVARGAHPATVRDVAQRGRGEHAALREPTRAGAPSRAGRSRFRSRDSRRGFLRARSSRAAARWPVAGERRRRASEDRVRVRRPARARRDATKRRDRSTRARRVRRASAALRAKARRACARSATWANGLSLRAASMRCATSARRPCTKRKPSRTDRRSPASTCFVSTCWSWRLRGRTATSR